MKNKFKLMFISLSLLLPLYAEELTIEKILLSVKDCSDDISIAQMEYYMGQEDVIFYRSEALPQVTFNTGFSYIARSITAMGFKENLEKLGLDDTHADGAGLNWALNVRQPVFSFGRVIDALKMAGVREESLEDQIRLKKDIFYLSVIKGYSDVYLAQASVEIAQKSINYHKKLLDRIKKDLLTGNGVKRDSLTIQAQVYKAESDLEMAKSKYKIAIGRLSKLTELSLRPYESKLIYNKSGWASSIPQDNKEKKSIEIKLKEYESLLMKYNADYEKGALFPSVYLISNISNDLLKARDDDVKNFLNPTPNYVDYFNPEYFNYAIGLQISWNIFDGRRSQAKARKARLNFEKVDRELKIAREENEEQINEAKDAIEVLEKGEKAVLLQLEALNIAVKQINIDYTVGFVDYTTILDLEHQLREAENYLNQIFMQRLFAVAQLKIASGLTLLKE
ncbi:MAG: TolC family protein [Chitinispirillia bacterium]|jgi:outer membrane protein TolC